MKKILIILGCLILLTGCNNDNSSSNNNDKIIAELKYFGMKIESLLNSLNNISMDNYELVSEKVQVTEKSQDNKDTISQQGSSNQSENQQGQEGEQGQQGQQGSEGEEITITRMEENSTLNIDTEDINWNLMRSDMEELNNSWSIVMLDLNNSNVSDNDIIDFGSTLNDCIISINSEDKASSLTNLSNLYSFVPRFLSGISAEKHLQDLKTTKNHIFNAYVAATNEDWNSVSTSLIDAENSYANILSNIEYSKDKEYKINKTYLLIKELQNTISLQDKSVFLLKYKTLIESLNTMS